ncbi:HAD hydrolase-like protein [Acaryochloris sp. IP29b_bin.137]|uniref:HAD hydrolase-like protein n=1 Tax=Acaryochloris sp. IP29b_bin.137 TaxID=2969217 RepID=UPI0026171043|nr:HAD hydrolase-like protein [Acaryochloris sp. IP29b_bin.137]
MAIIVFDLDGTLSDPAQGITASINYALENLGASSLEPHHLTQYIGPPLVETFSELLCTKDDAVIHQAIDLYRERYLANGYAENTLYPGILELLKELINQQHRLYVVTAKRTDIAQAVIDYFGLRPYFIDVLGCGLDRSKAKLLHDIQAQENTALWMIGDRASDMAAGRGLSRCVGVLWGYGSAEELEQAGAEVLMHRPKELLDYFQKILIVDQAIEH